MHNRPSTSRGAVRSPSRSRWTRQQAGRLDRRDAFVAPVIYPPETRPNEDVHVWDTWLLRDRHGRTGDIDGWRVVFCLTAPADVLPGKRHDVAEVRYFYSRDGRRWRDGGPVFDRGAFGQRQWAGSALVDGDDVYVYYTAAGEEGVGELTYTQRIAGAAGGRAVATDAELTLEGPWRHEVLLEPDGEYYEVEAQSRGMTSTFRDPWFYEDPATGETCLFLEGNVPVPEGSDECDGDPDQQPFNGCVGLAVSPAGDPMEWELRPPVLDAVCVNQELERPHVVRRDGRYYLFLSSHAHTFAPGIEGYDALYGFVADSLDGPYRPLNDTGLVVTNPAGAPFQAYSWMAFPHREAVLVQSFFNYYDFDGDTLDPVGHLPESEQLRRFGGTLAPTIRLAVDGDRTRVLGTLDHWHIPTPDESLPDFLPHEPGSSLPGPAADDRGSYE
jgi:levansucrase